MTKHKPHSMMPGAVTAAVYQARKAKAKVALPTAPGAHTVSASLPLDHLPTTAFTRWPKAKKARKQWCVVIPLPSKTQAEENLHNHNIWGVATIRYLPVGRWRKGTK